MRLTHHFGATLREAGDVESRGQELLVRAGYVRQLGAGIHTLLPAGWRAMRRIEQVVREEMDAIGAEEMLMPLVHPAELWRRTGRWESVGPELLRLRDRADRELALAMTHEEVITEHARHEITSYRQLPQLVYQIALKFRDEPRPRAGLIRTREFIMKDSYSFDRDEAGLAAVYERHRGAYLRIFGRLGLDGVITVRSDVGMMGGRAAHEFMLPAPIGEDTLVLCDACGDAANQQVAVFARDPGGASEELQDVELVATPQCGTIAELAEFLGVPASRTAKVVFFSAAPRGGDEVLVVALVRGDLQVNETKLARAVGADALVPAGDDAIRAAGMVPGYASPVGIGSAGVLVVVDTSVAEGRNLVGGANREGHHLRNLNAGRDFRVDVTADIAAAFDGAACSRCGAPLRLVRGVEVGNIFQLGTRYSQAVGAMYVDESGVERPLVMGSYGIGIGRLLACCAEIHHDDRGLRLPVSVAAYDVHILELPGDGVGDAASALHAACAAAGLGVLLDDRELSAGVKFADADLIGAPLRVTVSRRSLAAGGVELRARDGDRNRVVALADALTELSAELRSMREQLERRVEERSGPDCG